MNRAGVAVAASAAIYAVAVLWAAAQLPETGVAMHVNARGVVNAEGSRTDAVTLFTVLGTFLLVLAVASIILVRRVPARLINVPYKAYWSEPSRLPRLRQMLAVDMAVIFSLPLLAFSYLPVDITLTTLDPVGHQQFWFAVVFGLFVLGLLGYIAWMMIGRYRPARAG